MDDKVKEALKELGRQGGLKTSKKYGKEHYRKLAENMNKKKAEKKKAQGVMKDKKEKSIMKKTKSYFFE